MLHKLLPMLIAATLSTAAFADDAHHPEGDKKPAASTPATQSAKPAKTVPKKAVASTDTEKQFAAAQEQMKKMQAQMDKIRQTKDPKERQRLMQEHMQTMREGAQALRGTGGGMMMNMMDCPMMGGKDEKGGMGGMQSCPMMGAGSSSKANPAKRMEMMEKRMDMMQMMMEQMIERETQKSTMPSMP